MKTDNKYSNSEVSDMEDSEESWKSVTIRVVIMEDKTIKVYQEHDFGTVSS